jgi:hypothetical protein
MQTPGLPDLIAFLPAPPYRGYGEPVLGVALFVEVKARGGRMRTAQKVFAQQCFDVGVPHLVGGIDQVIQWAIEAGYVVT